MNYFELGLQFVKEKTGATPLDNDPVYKNACEHLEQISQRHKTYTNNINNVLQSVTNVIEAGSLVSAKCSSASTYAGDPQNVTVEKLTYYFDQLQKINQSEHYQKCATRIRKQLYDLKFKLDELSNKKSNRKKLQLLCDSAKSELESATKKGHLQKIDKAKTLYEERCSAMKEATENFIVEVDEIWEHRFELIEQPLRECVQMAVLLLRASSKMLASMQPQVKVSNENLTINT